MGWHQPEGKRDGRFGFGFGFGRGFGIGFGRGRGRGRGSEFSLAFGFVDVRIALIMRERMILRRDNGLTSMIGRQAYRPIESWTASDGWMAFGSGV